MNTSILAEIRRKAPLIHCITNYVTVNDVANVLLAIGARPVMADDPAETEEITALAAGLCLNIGTLNARTIPSMLLAGVRARVLGHPVVLDPVGAGASVLRTETALRLLDEVRPTVIRGNISEIRTLAVGTGTTSGVDADAADAVTEENLAASADFLRAFAARTGALVAVTGAIDLVTDGRDCYVVRNFINVIAGNSKQNTNLCGQVLRGLVQVNCHILAFNACYAAHHDLLTQQGGSIGGELFNGLTLEGCSL